jgi:hypothetical protein
MAQTATSLLLRRTSFTPGPVHVGFVVNKVAFRQVLLQVLWSFPVSIIPPWLSTLIYHVEDKQ